MQTRLSTISNTALLERLNHLISKNNQVTIEVLVHLGEVDARRLFAEEGFSSMFGYCIARLGMCGAATGRRIAAARAGRRFPLVLSLIGEGRLHLTGAALLAKHLTEDNHRQMLETACGMSKRQIETMLADLAPKPDVPDRIRKVRRPAARSRDTSSPVPAGVAAPLRLSPAPPPAPLGQSRFKVQFTATKELVAKLEKAKALLSHRVPDGDMATVIEEALEALIDKVEKDRFAVRPSRKRKAPGKAKGVKPTRHIPNAIKREVYERDGGQCTFVARDGHRCGAQSRLELHHVKPWGKGGVHSARNIALVCRTHNRLAADADYGVGFMKGRVRERA